ncbi:divalent-cation tolerance protein CutA [Roseiconus nitratireducens]|uniref:Divalent-cation tolerance protein CutA n=1 Tax=Roseiconus nitratireducens TaxID=2605748 RepID=A0A5M6CZ23_9BACT|nr:divalent-cation tolerance protein CutA [Roseiconus nitratireducens]KAA5540474.1 divalent-cation tolerance protein CutA [Roseiconus nitratireducens]
MCPSAPSRGDQVLICFTTVGQQTQAQRLARALLDNQLAACVQIDGPIESLYTWKGDVCCEQEYRLIIKTAEGMEQRLRESLIELHPYDTPQIVTLRSVDVEPNYRQWVQSQCAETDQGE